MNGHHDDATDEIELGDLENDAFLPIERTARTKVSSDKILTKWIPPRIVRFLENVSKIKVRSRIALISDENADGHVKTVGLCPLDPICTCTFGRILPKCDRANSLQIISRDFGLVTRPVAEPEYNVDSGLCSRIWSVYSLSWGSVSLHRNSSICIHAQR